MKKLLLFSLLLIIFLNSVSLAYSDNFKFVVETMGIEYINVNGKSLNEDIYDVYSLLVYGSPLDKFKNQRWKDVNDGLWQKNGSKFTETGIRGEYWILGENMQGYEVHNHKFPVDIEPPSQPTAWRYAILTDAKSSWEDQSKYMDEAQKEYMLNTNLTRNNITYDLKVTDIGLDKVRLENYATWKTYGTVYTQRYDRNNQRWAANFMIPPMAGDSTLESYAEFPNGTTIVPDDNETIVDIPIDYGALAINIGEYAKKEHVKLLRSELLINDLLISDIEGKGTLEVSNNTIFSYTKKDDDDVVILNVTVKSILLTKFATDGVLTDTKNYEIIIYFSGLPEDDYIEEVTFNNTVLTEKYTEFEDILPPYITDFKVEKVESNNYASLYIARKTGSEFICAGQTIKISATVENFTKNLSISFDGDSSIFTFDELTKRFEWDEPKKRNIKTRLNSLNAYRNMYSKSNSIEPIKKIDNVSYFEFTYIIPYGTKQTLNSWQTLRKESNNALEIDENRLFTRIMKPYEIVLKAKNVNGADTKRINLDVFERWDTLYNRDISKYIKK